MAYQHKKHTHTPKNNLRSTLRTLFGEENTVIVHYVPANEIINHGVANNHPNFAGKKTHPQFSLASFAYSRQHSGK